MSNANPAFCVKGWQAKIDDLKIGYDNNSDHDLSDAGDKIFVSEDFGGESTTFAYDDAGNLVDDGTFIYSYDP